jgi:DNA helicase HerA-like ATPase
VSTTASHPRNSPLGTLGQLLNAAPLWQVSEVYETVPRTPEAQPAEHHDVDRPRRLAAITAAYHTLLADETAPFMLGWARAAAGKPVNVFATATHAARADRDVALSYPPGSRGRSLPAADAHALLGTLPCWTTLLGVPDGLLATTPNAPTARDVEARPNLTDSLLGVWRGPFAWLLVAEPVSLADIAEEAERLASEERDARSRSSSPQQAVLADRLGHRHREVRMAESTGLWRVRLLAGGTDPGGAQAVAGLLAAVTDLTGLAYVLRPSGRVTDLGTVLAEEGTTFLAGSPLVAAIARPPAVEVPGIRVIPRSTFDVTPEAGPTSDTPAENDRTRIRLGDVIDREAAPAGDLWVSTDALNRHTFVCGATGSGKSQTIRHLLEQATHMGLPWLVIEPAKAEYRRMAARLPNHPVHVIRPGDPDAPPVGINPLEPVPGFPLQTHADLTRALFIAAFQAEEPFPQVLAAALTRCYERLGWDLTLGEPAHPGVQPRYPTLGDLQSTALEVVESIGYGREVTDNVRGFIGVRLASLRLGTTGRFFEGGHRLDLSRLVQGRAVLEIEDVGDDRDKAFLMGAMLIQLVEHLRVQDRDRPSNGRLRHLTVIEEAHRLLRRSDQPGPAAHAVELFASILAEVRAYGEGLVIAEQIPTKLIPDVIKNTAIKVVHRLPAQDDRDAVGATMNLDTQQSRFLVTLPPGTGAVFADGMDHPILASILDGTKREAPAARGSDTTPKLAELINRPAAACPATCIQDPCTLRGMVGAQRAARDEPAVILWAELAVLGHLVGRPAPTPTPALRDRLATWDARQLDCAIRHTVDTAVASRSTALASSHSPDQLAAHVATDLRAQLTGQDRCTDPPEPWLAPCYRWSAIHLALKDLHATDPHASRHPLSSQWAIAYGRDIPGDTCRDQFDAVRHWSAQLLRDHTTTVDLMHFGSGTPSVLESAVGANRDTAGWLAALRKATSDLVIRRYWATAALAQSAAPAAA